MTLRSLTTLMVAALLAGARAPMLVQTSSDQRALTVMILDQPSPAGALRLWIVVRNDATSARILCRDGWRYTWISSDPNGPGFGETKASVHGCGDEDHDAFWPSRP